MDDFGHGTHVAGIIGAVGDNNEGIAGVAWHVQLMALKFLDSQGNGFDSDAVRAVNFAISHGATVINCSWAGPDNDPALLSAFQSARNAGIIVVAAAGNGNAKSVGQNNDVVPNFPSNYRLDNIVAVAATDDVGNLASFSNYGYRTVDLAAPGVDILSTLPGGQYGRESGTSMSTAEVTGAVVLLHDAHPDWDYHQIIHRIFNTVRPLTSLEGKTVTGGQLDLAAVLTLNGSSGPRITSLTTLNSWYVNRIRVTFDRPVSPFTFRTNDITNFVNPAGQKIRAYTVVPVFGSNDRQFDVIFGLQARPGTYRLTIGPNISDFNGNLMNQDGDNQNGEPVEDAYTGSFVLFQPHAFRNLVHVPIPDMQTAISTITINQDLTIAGLTVRINIAHTSDSDLFIHLISPNGTDIVLSDQRGGAGHNYWMTTFDDLAPLNIGSGRAPFMGTFPPDGALSAFNGQDARGTWQLWVEDRVAGDAGTLVSWSLTIGTSPA
jgi:subtilisin-like proprotein convertase family protein